VFRVIWGVAGSSTARFAQFVKGPDAMIAYARGVMKPAQPFIAGHNPLGAAMVVALLAALVLQASTGLFAKDQDDFLGIAVGPLADSVSELWTHRLTHLHHLNHAVVELLIYVHILANVLYAMVLRQNLIGAMFTGRKALHGPYAAEPLTFAPNSRAIGAFAAAVVAVWAVIILQK